MSETLITGLTSEDLLADFESILSSGSIDLSEDHQIVIISTPNDVDIHSAAPNSAGEILLFATPQGPAPSEDPRRPTLGRPPVGNAALLLFFLCGAWVWRLFVKGVGYSQWQLQNFFIIKLQM